MTSTIEGAIYFNTWKFVQSYTPDTTHRKHFSSQYYSLETLFIPILFTKNTILNKTIMTNIDIIHNIHTIHTGTIHNPCQCQFLPIF